MKPRISRGQIVRSTNPVRDQLVQLGANYEVRYRPLSYKTVSRKVIREKEEEEIIC